MSAASQPIEQCWAAVPSAPVAPTAAPKGPAVQAGRTDREWGQPMACGPASSSKHAIATAVG